MIPFIRQFLAQRRLARITRERANSFEIQDYRKRRTAALKGREAKRARLAMEVAQMRGMG